MKAFKLFDKNHTGKITPEDLHQIALELGEVLAEGEIMVSGMLSWFLLRLVVKC